MIDAWLVVVLVGAATVALKAAGPVLLGGGALPRLAAGPVALLAPTLLAALVAVQAFAGRHELVVDVRALGLGAAALALLLRAPIVVVVVVAAVVTALGRALA